MAFSSDVMVYDFSDSLLDKKVFFKVIRLVESFYVWVGTNPILSNMAVAMPAKYENIPSGTTLFSTTSDHISQTLAQKLAKKYNKQVFVSCSVPYDQQLSLLIEKRLAQELSKVLQ